MRCLVECLRASLSGQDLIVPRSQVDPQRTDDLRLVVDDEDSGHDGACPLVCSSAYSPGSSCPVPGTAGRVSAIVSPPPGVSSGSRVPFMASVRPLDSARPSPIPVVDRKSVV